jgi:hypothetical protein
MARVATKDIELIRSLLLLMSETLQKNEFNPINMLLNRHYTACIDSDGMGWDLSDSRLHSKSLNTVMLC